MRKVLLVCAFAPLSVAIVYACTYAPRFFGWTARPFVFVDDLHGLSRSEDLPETFFVLMSGSEEAILKNKMVFERVPVTDEGSSLSTHLPIVVFLGQPIPGTVRLVPASELTPFQAIGAFYNGESIADSTAVYLPSLLNGLHVRDPGQRGIITFQSCGNSSVLSSVLPIENTRNRRTRVSYSLLAPIKIGNSFVVGLWARDVVILDMLNGEVVVLGNSPLKTLKDAQQFIQAWPD